MRFEIQYETVMLHLRNQKEGESIRDYVERVLLQFWKNKHSPLVDAVLQMVSEGRRVGYFQSNPTLPVTKVEIYD